MLNGAVALKEDDVQLVTDQSGDVPPDNPGGFGLYTRDTRFLSRFDLTVNGRKPLFLSNSVTKHYIATFQAVNPPLSLTDVMRVDQQTISVRRSRFVTSQGLYERIGLMNCNQFPVDLHVGLSLDADFVDIFAVRRFKDQPQPGPITVDVSGDGLTYACVGRDGIVRQTRLSFSRSPDELTHHDARFVVRLGPQERDSIVVRVQADVGEPAPEMDPDFDRALDRVAASYREWELSSTQFKTDNELFDADLLRASRYDVRTLLEHTPLGLVPSAGIPWYAVPFGRDAIITALQTLMYNPSIAEGTLRWLAAHQGEKVDEFREEEPGKILHELRRGELAHLGEIPHTPYFGTIDATPLFLVLFVEAMRWLQSEVLYRDILPAAMRALEWIDRYGDMDGDGYVEYLAHRPGGVVNHGWKDSATSVQYEDGTPAEQPIALVEVQGYVYQAKMGMARLLRERGESDHADRLEAEAADLKQRFNRDFWMEGEQFYALALDRRKRQVRSVTSNAGHCLWSGICTPDKADAVAERLLSPDMFSGWGVRTLSSTSPNYNPMSYHNGSVWPHDTALIALGLRRTGHADKAARLVEGMFQAGFRFSGARLPELFCGFARDQKFSSSPAAYVVSCSPQAWAAGSLFMFLQSLLDIEPDADEGRLHIAPILPDMFRRVTLRSIRIGSVRIDVDLERVGEEVQVNTAEKEAIVVPVA